MHTDREIIKSISLSNFKCYEDFETNLSRITILSGENAAGKSTIIQSILLFHYLARDDRNLYSTYNVMGYDIGVASDLVFQNATSQTVKLKFGISDEKREITINPNENDDTLFSVKRYSKSSSKTPFRLFYINAERIGPQLANTIVYEGWNNVGKHGQNAVYVMNQIDKTMRSSSKDYKLPKALQRSKINRFSANCEEWLNFVIPGTKLSTSIDPSQGIASIRYQNLGDTYYSPTATGFGISYVLPIIVQALAATMFNDSVLVVENPEAHLHPYSQSMMGRFLAHIAMAGTQIIVETHSEHFINGCRLELAKNRHAELAKILFLHRDNEIKQEEILLTKYGELDHWPKGFFDQEEIDLREILKLKLCSK